MKKYLIYELKKQLGRNSDPYRRKRLKKKLFYFVGFAVLGLVALGGLATWGAVTLFNRLASSVKTEQAQVLVKEGQKKFEEFGTKPLVTQSCLDSVTSLAFSPSRWLTVSLSDNLKSVTTTCFNEAPPAKPDTPKKQQDKGWDT